MRIVRSSLASLVLFTAALGAQEPVRYEIRFDNADHHEAEVTATFAGLDRDEVLEVRMSRSSPGRYALHEFAKNVYRFRAADGAGREPEVVRPDPHQWNVSGHDGTVVVRYSLFADRCDGTYSQVDNRHAHLNMPATFVWARGLESRPIRLDVVPHREGFRVETQLPPGEAPASFTAPDLDFFLDSPVEVGPVELHEWSVSADGKSQTIRLALHHEGGRSQGQEFAGLARRVVEEQIAMFGEPPRFDFGAYTFLADYLPQCDGDGMEHRNSTVLTSSRSLDDPVRNLGTLSHEFFHTWNVERIRPRSLEPFDFERANMSGELWFAEGFTSYYDDLTLKRAGITDLDRYARDLTGSLDAILNAPGRRFFSPVGMSQQAPFVDAAVSIDPTNRDNTYASYYPYGAVLALGLDLEIRKRFPGKSLDDFMRALWREHGIPERPYTLEDLEGVLAELTEHRFAREFFDSFIRTGELPDYGSLLALAGLELRRPQSGEVWLGASLEPTNGKIRVASRPLLDSPLYEAGVDLGDLVLQISGRPVEGEGDLEEALSELKPGEKTGIVFEKRGESRRAEMLLQGNPRVEVVSFERAGREVTDEIARFRAGWLSSRAKGSGG